MRKLILLLLLLTTVAWATPEDDAASVLDDFHKAASEADAARYFGHFAKNGIFLGTDMSERWTVEEFKAYAKPHFDKGHGWTYKPTFRNVYLAADGQTAWFDERLENQNFGLTRGSGVLVMEDGEWKIAQYHLTLPVPNELIDQVVEMIGKQKS